MLHLVSTEGVIFLYTNRFLRLVFELPVDGTDMPKNVAVLKDRTFRYVCNLRIVGFMNEYQAKQTK